MFEISVVTAILAVLGSVVMVYHKYLHFTRGRAPGSTKFDTGLLLGGLGAGFLWVVLLSYLAGTHQQELARGNFDHQASGGQFLTLISLWLVSWVSIVWAFLRNIWRHHSIGTIGVPVAKPALPIPRAFITAGGVEWRTPPDV